MKPKVPFWTVRLPQCATWGNLVNFFTMYRLFRDYGCGIWQATSTAWSTFWCVPEDWDWIPDEDQSVGRGEGL